MSKYTYCIECPCLGKYNRFIKDRSKHYCEGYMDAMRGQLPRIHLRMVRSDGKVMDEIEAFDDVGIGMVAGWPTAQQYELAAERALERAKIIRSRSKTKTN